MWQFVNSCLDFIAVLIKSSYRFIFSWFTSNEYCIAMAYKISYMYNFSRKYNKIFVVFCVSLIKFNLWETWWKYITLLSFISNYTLNIIFYTSHETTINTIFSISLFILNIICLILLCKIIVQMLEKIYLNIFNTFCK